MAPPPAARAALLPLRPLVALLARAPALVIAASVALTAWGSWKFAREVISPGSVLSRLGRPPTGPDAEDGLVHGVVTLAPLSPGGSPPCRLEFQRGKRSAVETVQDDLRVTFADGRQATLPRSVDLDSIRGAGPRRVPTAEQLARARVLAEVPRDREVEVACFGPTDEVYLQACAPPATPGVLAPCPGDESIVIAAGASVRPLVAHRAAWAVGWLVVALLGGLGISVGGARLVASDPEALAKLSMAAPPDPRLGKRWLLVAAGVALSLVGAALGSEGSTLAFYLMAALPLLSSVALLDAGVARLRTLRAARDAASDQPAHATLATSLARERAALLVVGAFATAVMLGGVAGLALAATR